jgi:hypothetical protein
MRFWGLFAVLCLIAPTLAVIYWQRVPPRPAQVAMDGQVGTQAVLDEASRLLQEFMLRHGHLPCPTTADMDGSRVSEQAAAEQILCTTAEALDAGVARGMLPWRALGMVRDPQLHYAVAQEAVDPMRCHLAPPARVAANADLLKNDATSMDVRLIPACQESYFGVVEQRVVWSGKRQLWLALPQGKAVEDMPQVPEKQRAARLRLSMDGNWLAALEREADADGVRWLHWWRLSGDRSHWVAVGRWRVPQGLRVSSFTFTGSRVLVAHGEGKLWRLADVPLWPYARAVAYHDLPEGEWRGFAALPDGRGVAVKLAEKPWHWRTLDAAWREAVNARYWPNFGSQAEGATIHPSGERALSWKKDAVISLWGLQHDRAWKATPLRTPSAVVRAYWLPSGNALALLQDGWYLLDMKRADLRRIVKDDPEL